MESNQALCLAYILCIVPLLVWILCSWNELKYVRAFKPHYSGSGKLPPGHMGFPVIGETLAFIWYFQILRRPEDFINIKRKRYGKGVGMYCTYLFKSPAIICCSPALCKFVLHSDDLFSWYFPTYAIFGGENFDSAGEDKLHARLRSFVLNSINTPNALKKFTYIIQLQIISSLKSWAEKGRVKGTYDVKKLIFEFICTLFVSFKPGTLVDRLQLYFSDLRKGMGVAMAAKIPGTTFYNALQSRKKIMAILSEELEKRKQSGSTGQDRDDLMEGLMRLRDDEGKTLSDEVVLNKLTGLAVGAYESTASALIWALYLLGKNPNVLQKLRNENMAVLKKNDFLASEDIAQLKYTKKVVEETMRLANIAAFVFRKAKSDIEYLGYVIPNDWTVIVWLRYLHTDPENFEDPMKFNPDRWNEPPKPGTYQAFGAGSRTCVGNMLARTQLALFLHHLVIGYKWELINPDAKINYLPEAMIEDGVEITFSKLN